MPQVFIFIGKAAITLLIIVLLAMVITAVENVLGVKHQSHLKNIAYKLAVVAWVAALDLMVKGIWQ